jgi:hypothetical protein
MPSAADGATTFATVSSAAASYDRRFAQIAVIRRRRGACVKGPKMVNRPHQVELGELLPMASTRLFSEISGPIGLTRDGAAV